MTEGSALGDYLAEKQSSNPAAPAGAQQMARAGGNGTALGQWLTAGNKDGGYASGAQSWLTGANAEGTNNGWDNAFVDKFVTDWGTALEEGTARNYFDRADATGVVTWDHTSEDGTRSYAFGDIYDQGKKTGNVFELYDRDAANLMMAPFILDDDTQAQTFSASDRMERLDREIKGQREDRNQNFENSLKALEFEGDVSKREEAFREGFGDEAVVGGGVLGGAALGAGIGSVLPGAGTAAGGLIGGAIGGVSSYLNRDSLTEQAARAYEVTSLSKEQFGLGAGISTGIQQWSGFGMRTISPVTNLSQGIYDAAVGRGGDGDSEFYRTDEEGKNKAPGWMRAVDVAATIGDSLLQFSNPVGLAAYTATMSGTIGGQVLELGATKGQTFDPRRGGFDSIFTDEDGNFDASAAAAGIGKIGIDAVQLGMVRGLAGRTNALRSDVGEKSAYATMTGAVSSRLPLWMGGTKGLADDATRVRAGGFSFTRNAEGEIVKGSGRATLGLLAPSEQLTAISARYVGMRQAALKRGEAYAADDFYRAAQALASGERKFTTALVNGVGEGYEEAVQAVLEPHSHGGVIDGHQVAEAALYGAAAGVGMQAGMNFRTPSAEDQMFAQAQVAHLMAFGNDLDRAEWNALSDVEKRGRAGMSKVAQEVAATAFRKVAKEQARSHVESVAGFAKVADAIAAAQSTELAKATDSTDRAFVITQLEEAPRLDEFGNLEFGQVPMEGVAGSARQMFTLIAQHTRGLQLATDQAKQQLEVASAELAAAPADTEKADRVAALTRRIEVSDLTLEWSDRLAAALQGNAARIEAAPTVEVLEAEVAELNDLLRRAFHREMNDYGGQELTAEDKTALARAVSLVFVRDPQDQAGSYQVLLPQVSSRLTAGQSDNVLEISHAVLTPISGDYDGDKIRQQAQLVFDDAEFARARGGGHFIGAGTGVNIATPKYEVYLVEKLAEAASPKASTTLQVFAQETLNSIAVAVRNRYDGVIDAGVLDEVLSNFFTAVKANDKDARATLMDGLADLAGGEITRFGADNLTNEWLWIDQLIVSTFQRFQEAYATHRPDKGPDVNTSMVSPIRQDKSRSERRAEKRATLGQTLAALLPGDSLFRKFQDLHYSAINAPVLSSTEIESSDVQALAMFYRELGQAVTRTDLEQIQSKDDITGRVVAQLHALARSFRDNEPMAKGYSQAEAMLVIANMSVQNMDIAVDGTMTQGKNNISLAQMLLKQSVMQDRREKSRIYDSSPELQAKHARLLAMTRTNSSDYQIGAEDAFVEVFGSMQLYTLLGDQANVFGPHLTVEQFVREYSAASELERRDTKLKLSHDSAYLGKKDSKEIPYRFDDMGHVSAFRSVVDSIVKVGAGRISMDPKTGVTSGELVRRSDRVSTSLRGAHANVRQALRQYLAMQGAGRRDGETDAEVIGRMLETNPDVARAVMNMLPNNVVSVSMFKVNGAIEPPFWLYEFFATEDAAAAEMLYWRNLLLAQWKAKGVAVTEEVDDGEHGRQYSKLNRRMHRIMYNLARRNDGGMLYTEFVSRMTQATDLETFLKWVNRTPGVRVEGAPIVGWVDDVAEFDKDKAAGGWTTILEGAELRESIGVLQQKTKGLVDSLAEEQVAIANDTRVIAAIRRVIRKDRGEDVQLDAGDRELFDRMEEALQFAGSWYVAMGPEAMVNQTLGALRGMYAKAHNKGVNPENVEPAGALDAQRDSLDYTVPYERMLASMTATNLDAVGSNLSHAVKDSGRTMDDYGRQVEWTKPTIEMMLDLFADPESRPMARAMLFPQVQEVDANNQLRPQLLFGKSLSDLLRGISLKEMFQTTPDGFLSNDAAFKYNSMIDGRARKFGGHHALQRAANDLVAARTSAAQQVLSEGEEHRMVVDAYRDIAEVLQTVGTIAAVNPGALPEMLSEVKKAQRSLRTARALGLDLESDADVEALISELTTRKITETSEALAGLQLQINTDPANRTMYEEQAAAVQAEYDRFDQQLSLLRSNDMAGQVVEMFSLVGSEQDSKYAKSAILDYIRTHLSMIERSQATRVTLNKLTQQLSDHGRNGQVDLTEAEWKELSHAVISVYLDDALHSVRAGGTVSPWPDPDSDNATNQKYYDTSWSYLVDDLMDVDSPLVKAAIEVARSNFSQPATQSELIQVLDRTVLDAKRLGPWTSDIIGTSIEANNRLNSASAAMAIAMAGNSPKRQAAIMAATRRTVLKPDESLLSTVRLSAVDLQRDIFDDVTVTLPGAGDVQRPLAQLNNRFAKSVVLEYTDSEGAAQTVDLMDMVGREWMRNSDVRDSGFKEIHLDRIKRAVDRVAGKHGFNPAQAIVNVEFFHPDSQPETVEGGPNWYNNVYFEGTSFKLDADGYESLGGSLWFSPNGISQMAQRKALDASKLGKPAIEVVETATAADRAEVEAVWQDDLAGVLREKARRILKVSALELEPEFYNAVYKDLKLRHFVRGRDAEGNVVLWTAEQVIAHQLANPGQPLPFDGSLWIPSDDVLRTMLGEQGGQGVSRPNDEALEFDVTKVREYRGVSDKMLSFFANGIEGQRVGLHETRISNRARQSQLRVNVRLDPAQRSAFDAKMQFFHDRRNEINDARAVEPQWDKERAFNPRANMERAVAEAGAMIRAEDLTLFWGQIGVPFGPRQLEDTRVSETLLHSQHSAMNSDGYRTGWIYAEGSPGQPLQGLLNQKSLMEPSRTAFRVAPGDLVVVQVDSFGRDRELAKKRLDYLRDQGAIILLGATDGQADMRAEMAEHLMGSNYERVLGSGHAYQPIELGSRYQNPRSRLSDLTATRTITRKNRISLFSIQGREVQEGGAWINPTNERLGSIAVSANLVPAEAFAGFNVPVEQFSNISQIEKVRQKIFEMDNPEGRALLKHLAHGKEKDTDALDAELDRAFDHLIDRLNATPGVVLPQPGDTFGLGDIIPLIDNTGRILFYRHGMKAPRRDQIDSMAATTYGNSLDAAKIAIYPSKREKAATIHTGIVNEFRPRAGYGLEVELDVPLQMFGDKKQLEWNGMKYVLTPWPTTLVLPEHGVFRNLGIDMVSDLPTLLGKEATADMVDNHANAFAYFGIDFLPDVTEFFFSGRRNDIDAQMKTREILHAVATRAERIPVRSADELIGLAHMSARTAEILPTALGSLTKDADADWLNKMASQSSVEAKIASAMLIYLMTPGARVDHVLRSGGFNNEDADNPDNRSRIMPRLFTQVFDDAELGSELRVEINRRLNEQIYNPNDGTGYVLHQDFTFESRAGSRKMPGGKYRTGDVEVLYHGTNQQFEKFGVRADGLPVQSRQGGVGSSYFTTERRYAEAHTSAATRTGRIIETKVYGKTLDLRKAGPPDRFNRHTTPSVSEQQAMWDALPTDFKTWVMSSAADGSKTAQQLRKIPNGEIQSGGLLQPDGSSQDYSFSSFLTWQDHDGDNALIAFAREHGYGKIKVPDSANFGGESVVAINEYIEYGDTATTVGRPEKNLRGFLSFPEAHSSGDNPVKNGMTFDDTARQVVSPHSSAIAYGATGAETAYAHDISRSRVLAELQDGTKDLLDGGAWRVLNDVPADDKTFKYWQASSPAEAARRSLARETMVQYRQEIVKNDDTGWSPEQIADYNDLAVKIVEQLRLSAKQASVVDFWIRQQLGQPAGYDKDGHPVGRIAGKSAIAEAKEILWAVENHYLPTVAGQVPLLHLHDLQMIYRANRSLDDGWWPRESMDSNADPVTDWDGWTKVALGSALTTDSLFDPMYLLSLDGFMHTYQAATQSLMDLPVSLDALKSQQLMDPDFNGMLVSVSESMNRQNTEPIMLEAAQATITEVLGGQRIRGRLDAKVAPASEIAKRRAAIRRWRKENDIPVPVDVTMRNFRKTGAEFIDEGTTTNAFIRGLIQLRLGTALINPALYLSMGPEQWIRGGLDRVANTITMQGTTGATAKIMAKRGWSRYTPEQLTQLNQLYRVLGQRNDFKALIYKDLGFKAPHGPGGRITRALEAYGRFGTSMQDPTYGMRADTVARRYLDGALQHILATPTLQVVSVENIINGLSNDPQWLRTHLPDAHRAGSNAVAQIRSMKNTLLNHTFKGFVDPMAESRNPGINVMGNLLFKIPMLFSNYAANVATTILGLQGLDQMLAMGLHGRDKGFVNRIQAKLRGAELPADADSTFDMSTIIEGVDLSRAFLRGALTHTGLFSFGLWAGGLGLSGEDEEMRRRRLLAENQGLGNIYDPRRIENDFRNADAIYLDALPFGIGNLFDADEETGRAMYQMHWMLKQFVSPVMGMEKFFQTGDFRHVQWGFADALGAFPLVNTMMFADVVNTAGMLTADAEELAATGEPEDMMQSANLLTRAVGTYERMLFENSFVNQLYIGYDRYDRNPYVLPLTDSDGTIQRDVEGNARPQNLALETFMEEVVDPETGEKTMELRRGYMGRTMLDAERHVLAENRATFAFVSSLFTGGIDDSDYWRYNMPIKTRTFEKSAPSVAEVTDLYIAGQGTTKPTEAMSLPAVTIEEVLPQVRNNLYAMGDKNGHFYTDKEVWAAAKTAAAALNSRVDGPTALAQIDAQGREHPTLAGVKALMLGLYHGSITFDSAAMRGFYATPPQRMEIQKEWTQDLVREGLELGLDRTQANKRAERLMFGYDAPDGAGIADIIWAPEEKLSYSPKQVYAQLNTTYVMGPDGRPWATGFERDKLMNALGLKPAKRMIAPEHGAVLADGRMNIMDMAAGLNTGLRALEPMDDTRNIPTDKEIADSIIKAIEDAAGADISPFKPFPDKEGGGSGWKDYGGWGGYGGYGGGGGGGGGAYFQDMYSLPNNVSPYGNSMPFINTSNPIIRRANVRRERVWSERGRLKQWQ